MTVTDVKKSWRISEELLCKIVSEGYLEFLDDFMIITKKGEVDGYNDEPEMLQAFDWQSLLYDVNEIEHIVMYGKPVPFKIRDRIRIFTELEPSYKIEDCISHEVRINYDYLIVLDNHCEEVFRFRSEQELAEYLVTVGDRSVIKHIFCDGVLKNYEKVSIIILGFKNNPQEFEFEVHPVPF